jgi:hypothetical protein
MEVVEVSHNSDPNPLYMDKLAFYSDGIILLNRIKLHTDYRGKYESGLAKMSVIGLGKEKGAQAIHRYGVFGLSKLLPGAAGTILGTGKILGGLALVENGYDKIMHVRGLFAEEILMKEPELLDLAKKYAPSFPVKDFDMLILDRMGKNISGVGIDTNVVGRLRIHGQPEPSSPTIKAILVTDLSDESHGNATGVGLADVITKRLSDKIDYDVTYTNIITSSFLERGKLPLVGKTDREALEIAWRSCGYIRAGAERIIRAQDTLHLDELLVSDPIMNEIKERSDIEIIESGINLMDSDGHLTEFNPDFTHG